MNRLAINSKLRLRKKLSLTTAVMKTKMKMMMTMKRKLKRNQRNLAVVIWMKPKRPRTPWMTTVLA